jgi:hypothetical protein
VAAARLSLALENGQLVALDRGRATPRDAADATRQRGGADQAAEEAHVAH